MKRYRKYLLVMAGLALFGVFGGDGMASYGKEEYGPGVVVRQSAEQEKIQELGLGEDVTGVVYVRAGEREPSEATVSFHTKGEDGFWKEEFSVSGLCGRNGCTAEKAEGDGKTPVGTYAFTMAFGTEEDPGSILTYHTLTKYDYWVDDPESSYYNRLVDIRKVEKDWKSAEAMASIIPHYRYGLALDYNGDCVPGKGSAIFLHCWKEGDTGTSGCIAIPEDTMKYLITVADKNTRIVIDSGIGQGES